MIGVIGVNGVIVGNGVIAVTGGNGVNGVNELTGLNSGISSTLDPKNKNKKNNYMNLLLTGYECKPVKMENQKKNQTAY